MKPLPEIEQRRRFSSSVKSCWYIFYTAPRSELIAYHNLRSNNFNAFLPTRNMVKQWKNRQTKIIKQVLFPSYIFVYTKEYELYRISQMPKIVTCITCSGKPSIVPEKDIEAIQTMLYHNQDIILETKFYKGERVRVSKGPLSGYEGILVEQKGKSRFCIQLHQIRHSVLIEIEAYKLEKIC